ncbi:MAG: metallophosphoesterase family protein [Anaerolineae bacterium]
MRILAMSDEASRALYHENLRQITGPVDILLGCGDLPYAYMDYVVTHTRARHALFVHGNHDKPYRLPNGTVIREPGGWRDLDRQSIYLQDIDVIVAGLQGSPRYAPNASYQYSEREMAWRALRLMVQLMWHRVRHGRYLDILITHAPARGIHDTPEGAHRGFLVFRRLLDRFKPRLFFHGHHHRYGLSRWQTEYDDTLVVNVHPYCIIDMDRTTGGVEFVKITHNAR